MRPALFLDRDGVINRDINHLYKIEDVVFIDGVFDTLKKYQSSGYAIVIVTNQAGIAKGLYSEHDYLELSKWMKSVFSDHGVNIDAEYYCPHHPEATVAKYKKVCNCRKPAPGMILKAAKELNLDLKKSILVGDKESDILAGKNAGIKRLILVRSGHPIDEINTKASKIINSIKYLKIIDCK